MEFRLDKEGKEFHHFEEFAKMYRAEVRPRLKCRGRTFLTV